MAKLQIVVDPLIADCLKHVEGKSKVDKIRWALCVYREVLRRKDREILNSASERYRKELSYESAGG
jgi:hypothetical protein